METLPIKYFDTHPHGDIMSIYTNDVDTLRQFIAQSAPQIFNSAITIVVTLVSMILLDIPMTIISIVMAGVMLKTTKVISQKSGKYFRDQQADLGAVDGYIEEMLDGQKVVKVFCHEEQAVDGFVELNNKLRYSADKANTFSNIMMPINANIGNISYVICAIIGALLVINGLSSIGTVIAFLGFSKNFTQAVFTDKPADVLCYHGFRRRRTSYETYGRRA